VLHHPLVRAEIFTSVAPVVSVAPTAVDQSLGKVSLEKLTGLGKTWDFIKKPGRQRSKKKPASLIVFFCRFI
jgi:hypothetical protein